MANDDVKILLDVTSSDCTAYRVLESCLDDDVVVDGDNDAEKLVLNVIKFRKSRQKNDVFDIVWVRMFSVERSFHIRLPVLVLIVFG